MPLGAAQASLEQDVVNAYKAAKDAGKEDSANPSIIITTLADMLTAAIHGYMTAAQVDTTVDVDSGQSDTVGGATSTPGTGTGSGAVS